MKANRIIAAVLTFAFPLISVPAIAQPAVPPRSHPETRPATPPPSPSGEAVKTTVEMKVLGVMAIGAGDDRRSSAIISLKGASRTYSPGQTIADNPDLKLVKVEAERVEFLNQGHLEFAPVKKFPEAGWGGNAPVPSASPRVSSSPSSPAPADSGSDQTNAPRQGRPPRAPKRPPGDRQDGDSNP
jgi:type II secretion system (T2SS) protein C